MYHTTAKVAVDYPRGTVTGIPPLQVHPDSRRFVCNASLTSIRVRAEREITRGSRRTCFIPENQPVVV
jgi:hypothetical protein